MTTRERIDHTVTLVSGMIIGATAMYMLDENRGAKRRAYARDKVVHAGHLLNRTIRKHSRDLIHRFSGALAEIRSSIRDRGTPIPDDILISRVRAQLGHVVSDPGRLEIRSNGGYVVIRGTVLAGEQEKIRKRIGKTRGVRDCRLEVEARSNLEEAAGSRIKSVPSAI
jgi:hypothetical protein